MEHKNSQPENTGEEIEIPEQWLLDNIMCVEVDSDSSLPEDWVPDNAAGEGLGADNTEPVDMEMEKKEFDGRLEVNPANVGGTHRDLPAWLLVFNSRHIRNCPRSDTCRICIEQYELLEHEKTCHLGSACTKPNCFVFARYVRHFTFCAKRTCAFCKSINEEIARYELAADIINLLQSEGKGKTSNPPH